MKNMALGLWHWKEATRALERKTGYKSCQYYGLLEVTANMPGLPAAWFEYSHWGSGLKTTRTMAEFYAFWMKSGLVSFPWEKRNGGDSCAISSWWRSQPLRPPREFCPPALFLWLYLGHYEYVIALKIIHRDMRMSSFITSKAVREIGKFTLTARQDLQATSPFPACLYE